MISPAALGFFKIAQLPLLKLPISVMLVRTQTEFAMQRLTWSRVIDSLVMVKLGQELGTSSDLAQAIAGVIDAAIAIIGRFGC